MSDPIITVTDLDSGIERLEQLDQWLDEATEQFKRIEAEWEEHQDEVAKGLYDEHRDANRKTDPSEHKITWAARTENRKLYREYRDAKLDLDKAQRQTTAIRAVVSGRQTQTNLEKSGIDRPEGKSQVHFSGRR